METIYGYLSAAVGAVFSFAGFAGLVCFVLGWIICYFTARRHPTEAAMINAFGTKYGTQVKEEVTSWINDLRGKK